MSGLNELYGKTMVLPSPTSGISFSGAPSPHEAANGLYLSGNSINSLPAYYFNGYVIANLVGHIYALYDENWLYPDADNEIWNLGTDGTGPVTAGLLGEPFPTVAWVGSEFVEMPDATLQNLSTLNALGNYYIMDTPSSDSLSAVTLPLAISLAPTIPHLLNDFPSAFVPKSYPSPALGQWKYYPIAFWVRPATTITTIPLRIRGTFGTLTNCLSGANMEFENDVTVSLTVVPERWQCFLMSAYNPNAITLFRFQATGTYLGALLPILNGLTTNEFYIIGNYDVVDLGINEPLSYRRVEMPSRKVGGSLIDKLIIALARGDTENGNLIYNNTPEAADSFRSNDALSAMQSLLSKGWTITR